VLLAIKQSVTGVSHHVVILRLTLVLLILYGATSVFVQVPLRIVCASMLIFPSLVAHSFLWWTVVVILVVGNGRDWYLIDNHKYLITYWAVACALTLEQRDGLAAVRIVARLLVGLVFAFACAWKVIGGGYLDGSFFEFTLLTDSRLQRVAATVSGAPLSEIIAVGEAYRFLGRYAGDGAAMSLPDTGTSLRFLALSLSWLGLFIEFCVAVSHLLPNARLRIWRHVTLVAFIALTYFLLPVIAFAFVLTVLGFAQCSDDDNELKMGYLALLAWMQLSLIPWQRLFLKDV
jgi:hypothetical protein